jgi:GNAT superfamily N-acetyltransferase
MAHVLDMTGWERRPWDSAFFGAAIAQIAAGRTTAGELAAAVAQANDASIECLCFLADADDQESVRAAEVNGFSLMDVRLTLECAVDATSSALPRDRAIRPVTPGDLPPLVALARTSHRNTRFHRDTRFDPARSDDLYAVWVERSVKGELADAMWVVDVDEAPRGYITASRGPAGASIGLVAVDEAYRGRGYGDQLLRTVLHWAAAQGIPRVSVVTQGRSAPAVRFYERAGFATSLIQLWYHRWLTGADVTRR